MPRPDFAAPEPLNLSDEDKEAIIKAMKTYYQDRTEERTKFNEQHTLYDEMFRGDVADRTGPWPDASNLHVQAPYWLADSINTRLVSGVWGQTPLVSGFAVEDDDEEIFTDAANLVEWHFQRKRMNARQAWSLISKERCIHGFGAGLFHWAKTEHAFRVGSEEVNKIMGSSVEKIVGYDGPMLDPLAWDDLILPQECQNLQPVDEKNTKGADYVGIRRWQPLSLIWKLRKKSYTYIDDSDDYSTREEWVNAAPAQDRSGDVSSANNQQRARMHDRKEGRERALHSRRKSGTRPNPEFETLLFFMPWEIPNEEGELEETECMFFGCVKPEILMGGFRLSDIHYKNVRPLIELHYQKINGRIYSMGVMEICKHLSAELDTIHNMRMDVGFATNMPFFFFRASSTVNPEKIVLRPLKGVPVDDIRDVAFPQLQNVTTFYVQEEQQLYTLIERVMGVTDLFLGVSPTRGAAARHATGFVGTQQEALARSSEVLYQDAAEFSHLCHLVYDGEIQFGPAERIVRLQGDEGPLTQVMHRSELWMRGDYDFTLGANEGMFSSHIKQEQSQALLQLMQISPIIQQDPGKMWEVHRRYVNSIGIRDHEAIIGPKKALGLGIPKSPDEENGEMVQMIYGVGIGANVHPNDNDDEHLMSHRQWRESEEFDLLGRPNEDGLVNHMESHERQKQQKLQMMQQQAQGAASVQNTISNTNNRVNSAKPALDQERIEPQLNGTGNMGAMGDVSQSSSMPSLEGLNL